MLETELLYKDEVYAIVGAAIDVHKELGPGYFEIVYQQALEIELGLRNIPFDAQRRFQISYKGVILRKEYIPDLLCFGKIIVELKALDSVAGKEEAQLLNYLKSTSIRVGLLINFGSVGKLDWKRFIY